MKFTKYKLVPLLLIVACMSVLSGCLFIAEKERVVTGPDVPAMVGDSSENKPVAPGVQKAKVIEVLGRPHSEVSESSELIYRFRIRNGRWLGCTLGNVVNGHDYNLQDKQVRLRFNKDGSLQTYRIEKADYVYSTPIASQPSN